MPTFHYSPQSVKANSAVAGPQRNTINNHPVLDFDQTTEESVFIYGDWFDGYTAEDITVTISWTAGVTTGDVVWSAEWTNYDGVALTGGTPAAAQSVTDAAPGTANVAQEASITFTNAQADAIAAGEPLRIRIYRDAGNVADTLAADASVRSIRVSY